MVEDSEVASDLAVEAQSASSIGSGLSSDLTTSPDCSVLNVDLPKPGGQMRSHAAHFDRITRSLALVVLSILCWQPTAVAMSEGRALLRDPETKQVLARLGVNASSLAAAGFVAADVPGLIGRLRAHLADAGAGLRAIDTEAASAATELARCRRAIRAGDSDNLAAATAQALARVEAAENAKVVALNAAFDAMVEGGNADATVILRQVRQNAVRETPTQFQVIARSEAQWVSLAAAIRASKAAARLGRSPDAVSSELVLEAMAQPQVAAAAIRMDTNTLTIETALTAALD